MTVTYLLDEPIKAVFDIHLPIYWMPNFFLVFLFIPNIPMTGLSVVVNLVLKQPKVGHDMTLRSTAFVDRTKDRPSRDKSLGFPTKTENKYIQHIIFIIY